MAKLEVLALWKEVLDLLPTPVESLIQPEASRIPVLEAGTHKQQLAPYCFLT